jgi:hypothetical protein
MDESLARPTRQSAGHACECCRMPPDAYYSTVPFPIEHIVAHRYGGLTIYGNLALFCHYAALAALGGTGARAVI